MVFAPSERDATTDRGDQPWGAAVRGPAVDHRSPDDQGDGCLAHSGSERPATAPAAVSTMARLLADVTPWVAGVVIWRGVPEILAAAQSAGATVTAVACAGACLVALALRRPLCLALAGIRAPNAAQTRVVHLAEPRLATADYQAAAVAHGEVDGVARRVEQVAARAFDRSWTPDGVARGVPQRR